MGVCFDTIKITFTVFNLFFNTIHTISELIFIVIYDFIVIHIYIKQKY